MLPAPYEGQVEACPQQTCPAAIEVRRSDNAAVVWASNLDLIVSSRSPGAIEFTAVQRPAAFWVPDYLQRVGFEASLRVWLPWPVGEIAVWLLSGDPCPCPWSEQQVEIKWAEVLLKLDWSPARLPLPPPPVSSPRLISS